MSGMMSEPPAVAGGLMAHSAHKSSFTAIGAVSSFDFGLFRGVDGR
jgi:hypothetical protein